MYYPRFIERQIREAMKDTRVVLLCGPGRSGKTTLAERIADNAVPFVSLDDATTLEAALSDPVGLIRGLDKAIIDEVQRAPDLLLAIKTAVDSDQRAGRFLLTGSADLMTLPRIADSLAGRMQVVRLLPLAQAEVRETHSSFLKGVFTCDVPKPRNIAVGDMLVETVLAGGYPEALARSRWKRRQDWHLNYVEALIQRDARTVAGIQQVQLMPRLLRILAEHSGRLVNYSGLGAEIGLNHVTTRKYAAVFESLFLVCTLQPWYTNALKRLTKTPKLHFLDAGLLAALKALSPDRVHRDRTLFGPVLETFVLGELLKLSSWSGGRHAFSHFRDKERNEVDIVIEDRRGRVVGVEVKASATVSRKDFSGLHRLAAACGDNFAMGVILYDHDRIVPFGDRMAAIPISTLWS